jgi:hypothetical protein
VAKALYSIEGLTTRKDLGMGHYGISITLDGKVANQILNHKVRRNKSSGLYNMMVAELDNKYGQIEFIKDSWLIRYIQLEPSTCSCFGIEGMRLSHINDGEDVRWTPHNIDSSRQAAKLLSIWLMWFNHMASLTGDDGKAMVEFPWCC